MIILSNDPLAAPSRYPEIKTFERAKYGKPGSTAMSAAIGLILGAHLDAAKKEHDEYERD